MSDSESGNGAARPVRVIEKWVVSLTYDTGSHHFEMGGTVPTLDVYLFLLEMAQRKITAMMRLQDMKSYQAGVTGASSVELEKLLKGRR